MIGKSISHYKITEKLGEGGMGVVYRAHDVNLDRDVALKILPEEVAQNPERLARFEREAKTVAALNHPNIVTIFSVEEDNGVHFITMELVEGQALSELLTPSGLPLDRFFDLAIPLADAVNSAHSKGVAHRDLKPANIMIDNEGRLKVLDFGLAKLFDPTIGPGIPADGATIDLASSPTVEGKILGTPDYMSPEQAEGKSVDHRSDIFSLGIILYEMITGHRPFKGDSPAGTISSILRDTPVSVTDLKSELPNHLGRIIGRCLAKPPNRRYQSALDLRNDLAELKREMETSQSSDEGLVKPKPLRGLKYLWIAGLVATAALVGFWIWGPWRESSAPVPEVFSNRVAIAPLENRTGDPSHDHLGVRAVESIIQRFTETGVAETFDLQPGHNSGSVISEKSREEFLIEQAKERGASLFLSGGCFLDGEVLQLQAKLYGTLSGKLLYSFESERVDQNSITAGIVSLRERIVAAVAAHLHPQLDITVIRPPSSFATYQAYQRVRESWEANDAATISHIRRALELDPEFHVVRLLIPAYFFNQGDRKNAQLAVADAERFLDQFTVFERALFRSREALVAENLQAELIEYRQMLKLAPNLLWIRQSLGDVALAANRPRVTIEAVSPILTKWLPEYLPNAWWPFLVITDACHLIGDSEAEMNHAELGLGRFPDVGHLFRIKATALAATGRIEELKDVIDNCLQTPLRGYGPGQVMSTVAAELHYHGYQDASVELAGQAVEWFENRSSASLEPASLRSYSHALRLAGRWVEAREPLNEAAESNWRRIDVEGELGVIAACSGNRNEASQIMSNLPLSNDFYANAFRHYFQACISAHLGDKDRAVALLREAFNNGLPAHMWIEGTHGAFYWRLHADMNLEPLWGFGPYEELIKPKD